jgi:hypothetical protein
MLPTFILFLYALLQNSQVGNGFWNFLKYYALLVVSLKYLAQLDLFCTNNQGFWILTPSSECVSLSSSSADLLRYRRDFLFGVYKEVSGSLVDTLLPYFIFLASLSFLKQDLKCKGLWDRSTYDLARAPVKMYFSKFMKQLSTPKRLIKTGIFDILQVRFTNFIKQFLVLLPRSFILYFYSLIPVTVRGVTERRLKPGFNFYSYYTYIQIFCVFYSFFFYSLMTGATTSITSFSSNYFSGNMVIFVFSLVCFF